VGKLARTTPARATAGARVADLAGAGRIETAHLAEAIHLRPAAVAGVRVVWRAWRANSWCKEETMKHNTKLLPQIGISCFFLRSW
jgi:hypothetical protein